MSLRCFAVRLDANKSWERQLVAFRANIHPASPMRPDSEFTFMGDILQVRHRPLLCAIMAVIELVHRILDQSLSRARAPLLWGSASFENYSVGWDSQQY